MGGTQAHDSRSRSGTLDPVVHASAPKPAAVRHLTSQHARILELQRSAGNAAVAAAVQREGASPITQTPDSLAGLRATTATSDTITVAGTDGASPFAALKALHAQAAKNVVQMGAHEWKVERYGRFLEGDVLFLHQQRAELQVGIAEREKARDGWASTTEPKARKALMARYGKAASRVAAAKVGLGAEGALDRDPIGTAEQAVARAETRLAAGLEAQSRVAAEKPVVGFAYDKTRRSIAAAEAADPSKIKGGARDIDLEDLQNQRFSNLIAGSFDDALGRPAAPKEEGRFAKWRRERSEKSAAAAKRKNATALDAEIAKRELASQFPSIVASAKKEATPLVQQSILSEQVVAVKRKQLKAMKATVKATLGRGTTMAKHVANAASAGVISGVFGVATFGVVEAEGRKTQGGYRSERRYVMPWTRFKEDLASLRQLAESRRDGAFGTSYVVLKGFNELVVKQIRNLFGGLATTLALLGLIPGAQPLLGVAAICALVSLGAAAMKFLVDSTLTAWNAVATYRNKDAYNERQLKGELMTTGLDAVGGALRVGGAFVGPAVANVAFGAAGSPSHVNNPFEMGKQVGGIQGGGDLGGIKSLENGVRNPIGQGTNLGPLPVKVADPSGYAMQQGIKLTGTAAGAGTKLVGKVAGAAGGTEALGSGASSKLEHDDRDQWRTVGSELDDGRPEGRSVPRFGRGGAAGDGAMAAELEKEAAVKSAAGEAQGRWAKEQGLGLVMRVEELQAKVANVASGITASAPVAAKDGPEAAEDATGGAGVADQASGTLAAVASVLRDGAAAVATGDSSAPQR